MSKLFAQIDISGIVFNVSDARPDVENVIECDGYHVLGERWDGENFVEVPKELRYKIFEKPRFIYALGKEVYEAIKASADDDLEFYKYILDNSPHVDMNIPEFRAMVETLQTVGLIDAQKLAYFLVQE